MIKWFKKQLFKLAKNFLNKNAPPGEFIAYINEDEAKLLKRKGGSGEEYKDTGIRSFFSIGDFLGDLWDGVTDFFEGAVDFFVGIFDFVVDAVSGLFGGMFDIPDMGSVSQTSAANRSILINQTGTLNFIPVVYGQRKVGGTVVFMGTEGDRNQNLYMAVVLSEGPIKEIQKVFVDGVEITDDKFKGLYSKQEFLGTDGQGHSSLLAEADGWDSSHKLSGVAYLALKFTMPEVKSQEDADKNPWQGVPKVQALIKGKTVKSAADAGSVAYESETGVDETSSNPADIILDYLRNPRYGRGLANNRINFASFSTARANFATTVTYADGQRGPLYAMNPVVNTEMSLMDNMKKMLVHCNSGLPYVQGKFKLKPQDSGDPLDPTGGTPTTVFDITEEHIIDSVSLQDSGIRTQANQARVSYINPNSGGDDSEDWSVGEVIYPAVGSTRDNELLAEDNNIRNSKDYNYEYITNSSLAGNIAKLAVENNRNFKTLQVKCSSELHEAEVGDIVTLTYGLLGISGAYYRIVSTKMHTDYTFTLGLREHVPGNYNFEAGPNVYYGIRKQRYYVGNTQRVPAYNYNASTGEWELITNEPGAGDTKLPPPGGSLPPEETNPSNYGITSIESISKFESPSFSYETLKVTAKLPVLYADMGIRSTLQEYDYNTNTYIDLASLDQGNLISRTIYTYTYEVTVNVEMDGKEHEFRVNTQFFPTKFIRSGSFFKTIATALTLTRNLTQTF